MRSKHYILSIIILGFTAFLIAFSSSASSDAEQQSAGMGALGDLATEIELEKAAEREQREFLASVSAKDKRGGLKYEISRVIIDPGHGGWDPGAVAPGGLAEKEITLGIAKRLAEILRSKHHMTPILTRRGDYYVDLSERTVIANQYMGDLFVSIHINASTNQKACGVETYFCSEVASDKEAALVVARENAVVEDDEFFKESTDFIDDELILLRLERRLYWQDSAEFSKSFQAAMPSLLGFADRGAKSANFYVLRKNRMPSVLLEIGFISNPEEAKILSDTTFQDKMAHEAAKIISTLG